MRLEQLEETIRAVSSVRNILASMLDRGYYVKGCARSYLFLKRKVERQIDRDMQIDSEFEEEWQLENERECRLQRETERRARHEAI